MIEDIKGGLGFGLTSGIITTLGLVVGLYSGTNSETAIIGGILTIAVADSLSDALGMHISTETQKDKTVRSIWIISVVTFISKFILSLLFLLPILLLSELNHAVLLDVIISIISLIAISCYSAHQQKKSYLHAVIEHLVIAITVLVITYFLGRFIYLL